ncbi:MAG TPA: hypothetical protein VFS20_11885 [Longimicrobium sp.]|nr:hypothetical protein [Longimicrobium sp.]
MRRTVATRAYAPRRWARGSPSHETTAEREDAEQADHLREMGCTHGQAYLWSRPVPAAQAEPLITAPPLAR